MEANKTAESTSPESRVVAPTFGTKPRRGPLPDHLPREVRQREPKETVCPGCGGELRKIGEDVSEMLEYVPEKFKVIRQVRPKLSCAACERMVQAAAETRPIEHGMAGPGLLAQGFRFLSVENNTITKIRYIGLAELRENEFRLSWEPIDRSTLRVRHVGVGHP